MAILLMPLVAGNQQFIVRQISEEKRLGWSAQALWTVLSYAWTTPDCKWKVLSKY